MEYDDYDLYDDYDPYDDPYSDDLMFSLPSEFITNFAESEREVYTRAVEKFGEPGLYIERDSVGNATYGGSLWFEDGARKTTDMDKFWRIFEQELAESRQWNRIPKTAG